jgi:tetratricopeptide (TPR) repeat protein
MSMLERVGQVDTVPYGAVLNNLGEVAWRRRDDDRAAGLFARALSVAEAVEGADSYRASTTLQNLGILARDRKDYRQALDYDLRALSMTLWPVSDGISRDVMVAYYSRLRQGLGRGDALREAKLALLKRPARGHPYYWAGLTQSGAWTELDGIP